MKDKRHNEENSDDEVANKKKRKTESHDDDDSTPSRRRTRSLSNADENYPAGITTEQFHRDHQITVKGSAENGVGSYVCPQPMTSFAMTPFSSTIRRALDAAGFANPTPTQAQAWPIALSGRDVITVAKTGSGKTCGFLLPAFHRLMNNAGERKRGFPAILVLAPTRELACQIEEECIKFGRTSNIRSACAYGGAPKSMQIRKIQAGVEVIIATPGRLNDLLEMKIVRLDQIMFLVLDEADRM